MPLTPTQKKWSWIAGGILLVLHFVPDFLSAARRLAGSNARPAVLSKPSPSRLAPVPPAPPASPIPPPASFT